MDFLFFLKLWFNKSHTQIPHCCTYHHWHSTRHAGFHYIEIVCKLSNYITSDNMKYHAIFILGTCYNQDSFQSLAGHKKYCYSLHQSISDNKPRAADNESWLSFPSSWTQLCTKQEQPKSTAKKYFHKRHHTNGLSEK